MKKLSFYVRVLILVFLVNSCFNVPPTKTHEKSSGNEFIEDTIVNMDVCDRNNLTIESLTNHNEEIELDE